MASKKTALNERYVSNKATFIKLGDWEIPDYFTSPENEYRALKETAGLIDLSHDGRIKVSGADMELGISLMTTIRMERLAPNTVRDAFLLNDKGGILDYISIFRSEKFFLLQTSCLAFDTLMNWLREKAAQLDDFEINDSTSTQSALEVRGPEARSIMKAAIMDGSVPERPNTISISQIGQARCLVFYYQDNGIDRFRINTGTAFVAPVYDRFMSVGGQMGLQQVGWRAQEMVRIENFMPGIGAEYDENTTPLEIGMPQAVDFTKELFVGRRAILHSTIREFTRKLVKLEFKGKYVPIPGDPIELENVPIGYMTSAVMLPSSGLVVGMGFVDSIQSHAGAAFNVRSQSGQNGCTIVQQNAVTQGYG